jgi:hypothetical protein
LHFNRHGVGDVPTTNVVLATTNFSHMPYHHLQYHWDVVELYLSNPIPFVKLLVDLLLALHFLALAKPATQMSLKLTFTPWSIVVLLLAPHLLTLAKSTTQMSLKLTLTP